jgi:hypothetical protein
MSHVSETLSVSFTTIVSNGDASIHRTASMTLPYRVIDNPAETAFGIIEKLRQRTQSESNGTNASNPIDNA